MTQAKLRRELLDLVKAKGFTEWTEIQVKAIPIVLEGKNCLIIAGVGLGKTECAVLPILSKLLDARDEGKKEGIQALYITPLRALNRDMLERLEFWCRLLGVTLAVRHGDTPQSERARQRDKPAQLFLTTPETLQSMLVAPKLGDALANVRFVVVDEVHELIESKRGLQLAIGLQRLKEKSSGFQIIGLSATVGDEEKAARFLADDAVVVKSGLERELRIAVECPTKARAKEFEGLGLSNETRAKLERVKELIESHNRTLLFVNTRYIAESLGSLLFESKALGEKIAVHHSSLSKESRVETEQEFKKIGGKLKVIICTSSLELGIDIGEIDLVIQYVSPRQVTRFLQRIGRSGHRKHLVPKGVLVAGNAFDCFENAVIAERGKQGLLESLELRENALDVAAHQAAGLALDFEKISLQRAFEIIRRALPFRSLSLQEFIEALQQMHLSRGLLFDGENIAATKKTRLYYYENVSTIRDTKKFFVRDAVSRKNVGVLDESFVSEYLREGATFIARGKAWKVLSVSGEEVAVEQTRDLSAAIPEWIGEEIPIPREVAEGVCELIKALCENRVGEKDLVEKYFCNEEAARKMAEFAEKQKKFFVPNANEIVLEANGELVALHAFLGTKANEALARALSFLLSASLGSSVRVKPSAYGALFEFPKKIPLLRLKAVLEELSGRKLRAVLDNALPATSLYRMKFLGVAKAFGVVSKKSELKGFGVRRLVEALRDSPVFKEALNEVYFDKLDVEGAMQAFDKRVVLIEEKGAWSPLAREFFEFGAFSELMVPSEPGSQVVQAFKENLFERRAELYCTFCARSFRKALASAEEKIVCPYCASNQVTLEAFKQVWEKKKKRGPLGLDEKKKIREANKVIALIVAYGRRALLALETFGVGPETATRVLARLHASEDELLADLLEAQKHFIKTRRFWKL